MEVSLGVLTAVIIFQAVVNRLERKEAIRRENDLLNRVMARDYGQYAQVELAKDIPPQPEFEVEEGIPV